jgi:uncharacterized protein (TIGR03435 family)
VSTGNVRLQIPLAVCVVTALWLAAAQEPAFDVASVRPNQGGGQASEIRPTPFGRFTATNATPKSLVLRAYGLVDAQLIGAPPWLGTERYDVDARAAAPPDGPEALMPHLRGLLIDRFKLKAHPDTRELPAYALTFARRDQQLGPQMRPTQADCTRATTLTQDEVRAAARDGWPPCGMAYFVNFTTTSPSGNNVKMRVRRSGITLEALATALQTNVDRPVVDQTALTGRFDVEYSYTPQPPTPGVESVFGPDAPPLFVALEEQLGLKLESRRLNVPVLVVDSIDRPTEN